MRQDKRWMCSRIRWHCNVISNLTRGGATERAVAVNHVASATDRAAKNQGASASTSLVNSGGGETTDAACLSKVRVRGYHDPKVSAMKVGHNLEETRTSHWTQEIAEKSCETTSQEFSPHGCETVKGWASVCRAANDQGG